MSEPTSEVDSDFELDSDFEFDTGRNGQIVWTPELIDELKRKANITVAPFELNDDYIDEQFEIYEQSIIESDGFDVVIPENMYLMDGIFPVRPQCLESLKESIYNVWAKYAIEEYNKDANKKLEFVDVIKVNEEFAAGVWYYLTFSALDKEDNDNGKLVTCRAKVWDGINGDKALNMFKIQSPTNDTKPT